VDIAAQLHAVVHLLCHAAHQHQQQRLRFEVLAMRIIPLTAPGEPVASTAGVGAKGQDSSIFVCVGWLHVSLDTMARKDHDVLRVWQERLTA